MRASEFLFEYKYDRDLTLKKYRNRIWDRMTTDLSIGSNEMVTNHLKALWDKFTNRTNPEIKPITNMELNRVDNFIKTKLQYVEQKDPSPDKHYVRWMLNLYVNGIIHRWEDLFSTIADFVAKHYELSLHKRLPKELSDINRVLAEYHNNFNALYDDLETIWEDYNNNKPLPKGNTELDVQLSDVRVIIPGDQDAACYYGQGTQWCTAATQSDNLFNHYAGDGPLIILIPNKPKRDREKYQLHFESNQFMNEHDQDISLLEIVNRFGPDFKQWLLTQKPELQDWLIFEDPDVIRRVVQDVYEKLTAPIYEVISDWEHRDDYYAEWLRDPEAHGVETENDIPWIDEDGRIDWDEVPSYTDYNDDAYELIDDIRLHADLGYSDIIDLVHDFVADGDAYDALEDYTLSNIPDVISHNLKYRLSNRQSTDYITNYIDRHIIVNSKTHQVQTY